MSWRELGPGDRLGDFTIERKLGQGGMGLVFVARQDGLGRQVALKVIEPVLAANDEFRSRFEHEARALGALTSKNVLTVHTVGDSDGMLYLATRLYPDGDLASLLEEHGPLETGLAVDLVAQVADGLADVHAIGLVHRDIKPANVLLARRPQGGWDAVLADFGVVRSADLQLTQAGGIIGTPQYMAPEMHLGAPATVASDLYALGCVLWSTLTGTPSYVGDTREQLVRLHLRGSIPQLPGAGRVDDALNRVLRTLLAKEPADRYPSAAAAARALREAVAGHGGAAPATVFSATPDPVAAATPRRRRARSVAVVVGSLVVVGAVVVALLATRGDGERPGAERPDTPATTGSTGSTGPTGPTGPTGATTGPGTAVADAITADRAAVREVAGGFVSARATEVLATGVASLVDDAATVAVVATKRGGTVRYLVDLERDEATWRVAGSLVLGGTPTVTGPGNGRERIEPFVRAALAAGVDAAPAVTGGSTVLTAGVADVAGRDSVEVLVLLADAEGATDQVMLTLSLTGRSWIVTGVDRY